MTPGDQIDRYVVEAELGSGGFGTVYRARHTVIDRPVALKVLHPERTGDDRLLKRFLQEARASAAVGSPHIVQVTDAGFGGEGQAFLAMELLEGEDLASRIDRDGSLPVPEAIRLAVEILSGLRAAHGRGIVHRDLKPPNVFLARQPDGHVVAKILDFGISKMIQPGRLEKLTQTGIVMGTPHYMAPEQFRGAAEVDSRADLYSCAVILYEMLSGRMPYDAQTYEELILRVFSEPPVPLQRVAPQVPPALAQVVERGLARDPDARWQTAEELSAALEAVARGDQAVSAIPSTARVAHGNESPDTGPMTDPRAFAATAWGTPATPDPLVGAGTGPAAPPTRETPGHTATPHPPASAGHAPPTREAHPRTPTPAAVASSVRPAERKRGVGRWLAFAAIALLGSGLAAGAVIAVLSLTGGSSTAPEGEAVAMGPMTGDPAGQPDDPGAVVDPPKPPVLAADTAPDETPEDEVAGGAPPTRSRNTPDDRGGTAGGGSGSDDGSDGTDAPDDPRPAAGGGAIRAHVEVLGDGIPYDDATRVVDRAMGRMRRCRQPGVTHRVRAQMLVGIGGRIGIAQPDPNSDHGDTDTARCVAQAIRASGPVDNTEMGGIFYANVTLPPP